MLDAKTIVQTIDLEFMGQPEVIACYVVQAADRVVLVDPGPDTCTQRLGEGLEKLGLTYASITDVLLTHIHFDHAGAAWRFAEAGATVHVHPLGYKHLADPTRLWSSAARIYGEEGMESLWGKMSAIPEPQLSAWDNAETRRLGGVATQALHTPGHAKHHIAWRVGDALFLGDVGGVCIASGPVEPPCPPPDIDIKLWKESLQRLGQLRDVSAAYRSHFGGFDGSLLGLACDELSSSLDRWVSYYQQSTESGDTDARAQTFIDLVEGDRPAGTSNAYQLANPAFMSVAGLQRALS